MNPIKDGGVELSGGHCGGVSGNGDAAPEGDVGREIQLVAVVDVQGYPIALQKIS